MYGPARRQRLGAAADASVAALEQEQESALLSELAEGDFSADQNIVEVRTSTTYHVRVTQYLLFQTVDQIDSVMSPFGSMAQNVVEEMRKKNEKKLFASFVLTGPVSPWRNTPYRKPNPNLQVWVVGAELEPGVLSAGASSFIVVDFFDFESQATPLLPGISPAFDFATTFKVRTQAYADVHCPHGVLTPSPFSASLK